MSSANQPARIAIIMGSKSDWATMRFATEILDILHIPHHVEVVSAHRSSASPKARQKAVFR